MVRSGMQKFWDFWVFLISGLTMLGISRHSWTSYVLCMLPQRSDLLSPLEVDSGISSHDRQTLAGVYDNTNNLLNPSWPACPHRLVHWLLFSIFLCRITQLFVWGAAPCGDIHTSLQMSTCLFFLFLFFYICECCRVSVSWLIHSLHPTQDINIWGMEACLGLTKDHMWHGCAVSAGVTACIPSCLILQTART